MKLNKTYPENISVLSFDADSSGSLSMISNNSKKVSNCLPCGPKYWSCKSVISQYCDCIPRELCRDNVQHCVDWSDEYICPAN
ncbi:low-density lipoprotein receptor class A domain-containing protein 1-like isoform X2 [Stegostoma tigrinum]|uniref:low-density lipoprotein receptor class A domain-containing protein 1-like isoform X2 n=1 Tax=Stegostoma tigrinum TaxID=3053191 RepID=UPI00202B758D|nr:low-density lipoprotein receptor class A domain-containing protein 1-like isoform X2 [Stegostoma tigrinum]